jgi:GT2 family glycosyltransferase
MKIFAVVPTYNRPELLRKNLDCLLAQSRPVERIVLVDNASRSDTAEMLRAEGYLANEKIEYIRLDVNTGASGGFKTGMEAAMAGGADWIWGMDDDAFPTPNALEKLLDVNRQHNFDCLWSNVDEDSNFSENIKEVRILIFVGYFVSRKLVEKVGYPDIRYYMYHDDTDYSNRIIENGYSIYKVQDSIIEHKGFDKRGVKPMTKYNFGLVSFSVLNCEPYRMYYISRNSIFVRKTLPGKMKSTAKALFIDIPKYALTRPRLVPAIMLGIAHAAMGKVGRVDLPSHYY